MAITDEVARVAWRSGGLAEHGVGQHDSESQSNSEFSDQRFLRNVPYSGVEQRVAAFYTIAKQRSRLFSGLACKLGNNCPVVPRLGELTRW